MAHDGRHSWLGRNSDPSPEELRDLEASLRAREERAFLSILDGDYWSEASELTLFLVRPLGGTPEADWEMARQAFLSARSEKLKSTS